MENLPPLPPDIAAQNKGPTILWTTWTITVVATLVVALRLFVRFKLLKCSGLDDYLIILAMVCGYLYISMTTVSIHYGNGKHTQAIDPSTVEKAIKFNLAGFPAGVLSFIIPKLAVVALLVRLLNPNLTHQIMLWTITGGTAIYLVVLCIILFAQCDPPRALWDFSISNPKCWPSSIMVNLSIVAGAVSAGVDLYLALYPATALQKLQMHWKKKLCLTVALGLGCCASAISAYKCTRLPSLGDKLDSTYSTADLVIWACIEANTLIIAACIPTLGPLLQFARGKRSFGGSPAVSSYYKQKRSRGSSTPGVEFFHMKRPQQRMPERNGIGSQESILDGDADKFPHYQKPADPLTDSCGGIQRTDDVFVEYGATNTQQYGSQTWRIA